MAPWRMPLAGKNSMAFGFGHHAKLPGIMEAVDSAHVKAVAARYLNPARAYTVGCTRDREAAVGKRRLREPTSRQEPRYPPGR